MTERKNKMIREKAKKRPETFFGFSPPPGGLSHLKYQITYTYT